VISFRRGFAVYRDRSSNKGFGIFKFWKTENHRCITKTFEISTLEAQQMRKKRIELYEKNYLCVQ